MEVLIKILVVLSLILVLANCKYEDKADK